MISTENTSERGRHRIGAGRSSLTDMIAARQLAAHDLRTIRNIAAVPVPRVDIIGDAVVTLAAELYQLGAWVIALVGLDRGQCTHCQEIGHGTVARFYPNPHPSRTFARAEVPDACGHCAPGVLRELLDEAEGRDVHVEIWHPRAVAA